MPQHDIDGETQATAAGGPATHPPRWVLIATHMAAASLLQSTATALFFIMPILAKKRFGASDWQTVLLTMSSSVLFVTSIFWGGFFARRPFGRYMLWFWAVASLPVAFIAFAQGYWFLFGAYFVACLGTAGLHPASGEILRRIYPERSRGRIYSFIFGFTMVMGAAASHWVGKLLERDGESFRVFLPCAAGLQLAGALLLTWLSHAAGNTARRTLAPRGRGTVFVRAIEPLRHLRGVLRDDPVFARYEGAYMTYGAGWMIAFALLPLLVTEKLKLNYEQVMDSTHVPYLIALVLMLAPAGLLMDRLGPARSTAISFALLALHPLGLIGARDLRDLLIVSCVYGVAHAGASVGWMLGPVTLAPTPEKAPQYIAIHATLVGVRGAIFQGLGLGLYLATGSFTWPLAVAAGAYLWSAAQMWTLHGSMRTGRVVTPPPVVAQDAAEGGVE